MKKDEKLKALFERFDNNIINDIQAQLDEELSKSDEDLNPDKIAQLTSILVQMKGGSLPDDRKQQNIEKITDTVMANQKRSRINKIYRLVSAVCACLAIVIGLNVYTMNTFGEDLFSAAIKKAQSGFSLDFSVNDNDNPEDTITQTTAPGIDIATEPTESTTVTYRTFDPTDYGTTSSHPQAEPVTVSPVTETEIATIFPVTETGIAWTQTDEVYVTATMPWATVTYPNALATTTMGWATETYIPGVDVQTTTTASEDNTAEKSIDISNYIDNICRENNIAVCSTDNSLMPDMENAECTVEYTQHSADIYLYFRGRDGYMNIIIEQYYNRKDIPEMLIPSNTMSYDMITVPCGTAFLFTENNITTAVFMDGNTVYTITGKSTDPDKNIIRTAAEGFIPLTEN
ncbi:MAG: hypothetical protein IJ666_00400 [Ruminococcus sp.]|nr:hypothetical protein [Ruminococcus sp.]